MKNTARTRAMNKTFTNIVAVITALSLVFLQMPIVNFAQQARADAAAQVSAQAEATGAVDVQLSFEHAFITYNDQVVAPPASKITLPLDTPLVFTAEADNGYEVDSVIATLDGQKTTLKANDDGGYKISASSLQSGEASIEIKAVSAPEPEVVEESTDADEESRASNQAEEQSADEGATTAEPEEAAEPAEPATSEAEAAGEPTQEQASEPEQASQPEEAAEANAAAQASEEPAAAATPAKATAKRKAAKAAAAKVQAAALSEGTWDLADTNNTKWFHVSADSNVTDNEQQRNASFQLTFTYSLTEEVVKAMDAYNGNPTLVYDLSDMIANAPVKDEAKGSGTITIGTRKLGTYTIADNKVTIVFTDQAYLNDRTSLVGYFTLTMETDETKLGSGEEWDYVFPGTTDVIPIHYTKTVSNGTKSVSAVADTDGNYTLTYAAKVTVNTAADSLRFIDTLGGMQTLDASSVKINNKAVNVSKTGSGFEFDVASALGTTGVDKGTYTVTYQTKVTADQLKKMSESKDTETNTASWKVNGSKDVPGGETRTDLYKPRETVPVTKTITDGTSARQPGDTVSYKITYGNSETKLAGLRIADYMTDVQTLQGDIVIEYGSTKTTIPASAITADDGKYSKGMVTLFDYTLPNNVQGNGPVTVTYKTKLIDADTAKANGIYDSTDVANTAQEKRYETSSTTHTTVKYEKEKVLPVTKTESSAKNADGKWTPGSEITYTLTVGDADTDMAGVNISDSMTDLQVLQGDVKIKVGNGAEMNLKDYVAGSVVYSDDGHYSTNDVTLLNFTMPANAGKGPVVITYTTKVIGQDQASDADIYGEKTIRNTGRGGNGSAGTSGTGVFENFPVEKKATVNGADVSSGKVKPGDTVHYTLTFGNGKKDLAGTVIYDSMTDVACVVSDVVVKKADGSTFTMPTGSGAWASDGYVWDYFDDGSYNQYQTVRVFAYKLPAGIGSGPITVEYDVQILSEDEAKTAGLASGARANNTFTVNNVTAQTNPIIDVPSNYSHTPQISKSFDRFDLEKNLVYWNITVEKKADSAYPLENVVVYEALGNLHITEPNQGYNNSMGNHKSVGTDFDVANAVVTTDDGVVLTPGVDYTIDKDKAQFTFPTLNERVHINLAYKSPAKIIDGFKMENHAVLGNPYQDASATCEYNNPGITLMKDGKYDESSRIIEWEVQINPTKEAFADADPEKLIFEDLIPEGLTVVNYANGSETDPTIHIHGQGDPSWDEYDNEASIDDSGKLTASLAKASQVYDHWDSVKGNVYKTVYSGGLNKQKYIVKYKTKLSDEAWDALTSSATGSQEYTNHVTVAAGDGQQFETTGKATVTSEEFIVKTDSTKETGGVVVDDAGNATKAITYTVEINPHGYTLNPGKTLSVTDYIDTNMDLDTESVTLVKVNDDGTETEQKGVAISYNDDSRLLSISNIPDKTHFRLSYSCNARAQGQDTFKNTATLIGAGSHSSTTIEEHKVQTSSAGVRVDSIETFLHKIDENDIKTNLNDAKFQLYECKLAIGDLTNEETYDQAYWDKLLSTMDNMVAGSAAESQVKEQFKIEEYVPVGDPVSTKDAGFTQWNGLSEHKLYAWKEIEAPKGYTANDDYHYFVGYQHIDVNTDKLPQPLLSDAEQLNRKHAAWALDDATQLANGIRVASMANLTTWTATNIKTEYTSITATKAWEGDSDNLFETRPVAGISLQLYRINADGTKTAVDDPVAVNADDNGEWPSYIWSQLPAKDAKGNELHYTVVEAKVPNYSTTYSDEGTGVASGTITVTNKMIPKNTTISVKKEFGSEVPDSEKPEQVIVDLMVIKTDKDGNSSDPEPTGFSQALSEQNGWQAEFTAQPTTDDKGHTLTYTVRESGRSASGFTVTYSDNQEGVVEATADDPLVVTNSIPGGNLKVVKSVEGVQLNDEQKQAVTFTVANADGDVVAQFTLADMGDALSKTVENLPAGMYTVTEQADEGAVPAGYKMTTTYNVADGKAEVVAGETAEVDIVNAYEVETTSVSVKKTWDDADDQDGKRADVTINLLANGRVVQSRVLTVEDGTWSYTFDNLPKSENGQLIEYTVSENPLDGYTSKVSGSAVAGYTVTNTHTPETTKVAAKKVWDDNANQDGKRVDVTLHLTKKVGEDEATVVKDQDKVIAADATGAALEVAWEDLPKYEGGVEVVYGVSEDAVSGYATTITGNAADGFTVTNTHAPETTKVEGEKVWQDANDQDGKRPESVTVKVLNGNKVVAQKTVSAKDGWKYSFTDLPKYANGKEIAYTVDEDVPAGYEKKLDGANIVNIHTPETTDVKGTKAWFDDNDKAGNRPDSVTVNLFANGEKIDSQVVKAAEDDTWSYEFANLPKYKGGEEVSYTVSEDAVTDYETAYDGTNITNTYKPDTVSVSGAKEWSDGDNRDNSRPASITIRLLANGEEVAAQTVTADDDWKYSFNELPKRANGTDIVYTIVEDEVAGYATEIDGYNVKNSRDTDKIDVTGTKTWDDNDDQDGKRPSSITVRLYADGVEVASQQVESDADGNWSYAFAGLDKNRAGKVGEPIVYTVSEDAVDGYDAAIDGVNVTNTHTPETVEVEATKVWDDNANQDGKRVDVTLHLTKQVGEGDATVVGGQDKVIAADADGAQLKVKWTDLPKYEAGQEIAYGVAEDQVDGYVSEITGTAADGFTVTNVHTPETVSLSGSKTWEDADDQDGKRPGHIVVNLLDDGTVVKSANVEADADGKWAYAFDNLPKYRNGEEIKYSVSENTADGYDVDYTATENGFDIVNTHTPGTTSVSGAKVWEDASNQDGKRPTNVTVNLLADGKKVDSQVIAADADGNWGYSFTGLPEYESGHKITYTVEENAVAAGYKASVDSRGLVNTHIPETVNVSGTKTWEDADNQDGKRPASITVYLKANGAVVRTATVTDDDGWKYAFAELPKYADGKEIAYTIEEEQVDGYTTTASGYDITNTHIPETTEIVGSKTWDDAENQDGKQPSSITVNLLRNGEVVQSKAVSAADNWAYGFEDLPVYTAGEKNVYTIDEETVKGYDKTLVNGTYLVNTHTPETVSVSGTKTWDDANNQDGMRPTSITVHLLANGSQVEGRSQTVTPDANGNWTYTFDNLPKYAGGTEISYTVTEDAVEGYAATYDGMDVKNTHTPGVVTVSGTKTWSDDGNRDNARPASIVVKLMNGSTEVARKTVTATNNWSYSFDNLPEKADGQTIEYTVEEEAVEGYDTSVDGYDIANMREIETVSIPVSKVWDDSNNRDGVQPESVRMRLLADGVQVATEELNATNGWTYTFENLPKNREGAVGQAITYTLNEDAVAGYTTTIAGNAADGFTVTNTHTLETTKVEGEKTWNDENNQDGMRPDAITVNLLADGTVVDSKTVKASDNWAYTFDNLPKYAENAVGKEITYTITEDSVENYEGTISGYGIENTHTPETTKVEGVKTWNDNGNQDGKRPKAITVNLLENGSIVKSESFKGTGDEWTYSFDNLPKYKDGVEIAYTVTEEAPTDYAVSYSADGFGITNSYTPEKTSVSGSKIWDDADNQDGKRPESVVVKLLADGVQKDMRTVTAASNWAYTFDELPKYKDGELIEYTVEEEPVGVAGYVASVDGFNVKNSYTPETTSISGKKVWDDADNQDGIRPDKVTVNLWNDTVKVASKEVTAGEDGSWSYTFDNLPKYANGNEIAYTVTEDAVEGYETSVDGFTVTNKHDVAKTSVSGIKTWSDANNQDGKRPTSVTVRLKADGTEVAHKQVAVGEDGSWAYTFDNLDKFKAGKEIAYTVAEDEVAGYESSIAGTAITNTHTPEKTSVSGTKIWDDADDQDGKRPTSITVNLLANGEKVAAQTASADADGNWSYTFDNLDKYKDGALVAYTVEEEAVANYTTTVDGYDITNTHTPEKTSVSGKKTWDDADNQDGVRPTSITVNLLANGKKVDSKTVTEVDGWAWTFDNLDKYANGEEVAYAVTEDTVEGYEATVDGFDITNTHDVEKTSVGGEKIWNDADDQDGIRPKSITVRLLADGTEIDSTVVPAENGWAYEFANLDKYKAGKEIVYTVAEEPAEGYEATYQGYNITNKHTPGTTSVSGTKIWDDNGNQDGVRPTSVTVRLLADGTEIDSTTTTAQDGWSWSFTDLPEKANGTAITYTVTEDAVEGYETAVDGFAITNTHTPEKTSVSGEKTWDDADDQDGIRPAGITVRLLADGTEVATAEATAEGGWTYAFDNLDKYKAGKEIVYTVAEEPVEGYETTIKGFAITNTHTPETITLEGAKSWVDADNQDGIRPGKVLVNLLANGEKVAQAEATADNGWKYRFADVAKYAGGEEITYTVEEEPVAGYEASVDGLVITNTHTPEKTSVSGTKTWNDADNQDGVRPSTIIVNLLADGEVAQSKTVGPDADGNWAYEFANLDKYKDGKEIVYTVTEDAVADYATTYNGYAITNTHTPGTTAVSGTKTWNDDNDRDGLRPESITVSLLADGQPTGKTAVASEATNWAWSFDGLPEKAAGKTIVYTVAEAEVPGYTTSADGANLTNTHEVATANVRGTKTWDDADNQDGKRPKDVTVNLKADGTVIQTATVTPDEDGNWSYAFDNLPKYRDHGTEIAYTVSEQEVAGYEAEIDGANIANTHKPETTSVSGEKTWNDNENQDGKRPASITVNLFANGEKVSEQTVTSESGWKWTFDNLPRYEGGQEIAYAITEDAVAGYTANVDGYDITNTHTPEKTSVSGTKTWSDDNNRDGIRPAAITVVLYADGTEAQRTAVAPAEDGTWAYEFTNLDKYKAGSEIVYTVAEAPVSGYAPAYTVTDEGFDIDNVHTPDTTSVSGTKDWQDAGNQDGKRPASITVNLLADGTVVDSQTVTADDNWSWSFENLTKYRDGGEEIVYTVDEDEVAGYAKAASGKTLVNAYTPEKITVSGSKAWDDADNRDGIRPASITVHLLADEVEVASKTVAPDADGNWAYEFTGLDKYKNGKEISYTVTEDAVEGYTAAVDGYNITNAHTPEKTSVSGTKTWADSYNRDGKRPAAITVTLLADNQPTDNVKTVTADDNWAYTFDNLPKYAEGEVGREIVYTVSETAVADYDGTTNGMFLTNWHDNETIDISGTKTWADNGDQDGIRPDSVTVKLLADGQVVKTATVTGEGGEWAYSFADLPKYKEGAEGVEIGYTVIEGTIDGYTTAIDGFAITNTHTPDTTELSGKKVWEDEDDQDGIRPASVTIRVMDGETVVAEQEATAETGWEYSFTGLPKYRDHGTEITYTVDEVAVEGYEMSIDGSNVVNTHAPQTVEVSGTKIWADNGNQDGKRPSAVQVSVYGDDELVATKTVTGEGDEWAYSFTGLPKYRDHGTEITYTVKEATVAYYATTYDGTAITNTHTPDTTAVSGTKTWNDASNQDGKRPTSITVNLLANGERIDSKTVTAADDWAWAFADLPVNASGEPISYTVTEEPVAVDGYAAQVSGYSATNSYTPETTSVEGVKVWSDNDDQDGKRPDSVTVRLLANGVEKATATATATDGWAYKFENLPKYADGAEIAYTVAEVKVPEYETAVQGYNLVNTHETETVDVSGTKTWEDANDQDGKRPESITVRLLANGTEKASKTVTAADNWKYTFAGLDKYANGQEITYAITEDAVEGYTTAVSGYDVTNAHTPEKTSVSGTKTWEDANDQDGKRPESITVRLLANGTEVAFAEASEATGWAYSFTNLDKYAGGKQIVYTVVEDAVEGYAASYDGYDITNTHVPGQVNLSGSKIWDDAENQDGIRPAGITVRLLANGTEKASKTVTAADNWSYSFTDLPEYEEGQKVEYTVSEDEVEGYETQVTPSGFTNIHTPETVKVEGSKTWDDADDQDGKRPESITINLFADGQQINSATVTADDGWAWSFDNLPKFKEGAQGQKVVYTVTEDAVEGYTATVDGYDVTNAHTPEKTSVSGKKVWADADNQDGIRPSEVIISLFGNDEYVASTKATAESGWTYEFTGLDKYANGSEITYTISENEPDVPEGYTGAVVGTTVTNTHTPETTELSGKKVWADADNQDGIRPASIVVDLLADGDVYASQTVSGQGDEWAYSFTDLPKYKEGQLVTYTVAEKAVDGYATTYDGTTITNTHTPGTTSVSGHKVWADDGDRDGLQPNSITMRLLADGTEVDSQEVTAADNWAWSFADLPEKAAGKDIVYTVAEDTVDGYAATVDGYDVTNTHATETVKVEGAKTWNDADNRDNVRPSSITVNLLADGEIAKSTTATAADGWKYSFDNLPKYRDHGTEIAYTVSEAAIEGYEATVAGTSLTNDHEQVLTEVTGTKTWVDADNQDGVRPVSVAVHLLADGEDTGLTAQATAENGWTYSFDNLPKYADGAVGKEVVYTVAEDAVDGYEASYDGMNVTNAHTPEKTSVSGTKTWSDDDNRDGIRPASITVNLMADGTKVDSRLVTADDGWNYRFDNLDKFKDGKEIVYTVSEDSVAGYATEVDGFDITNTHTPDTTSVSGTKDWQDVGDQDGKRPASITVRLLADGAEVDSATVTADDNWTWNFDNLPTNANGAAIAYTVTEDEVTDYAQAVSTASLVNTHVPETVEVAGTKTWDDADNRDGRRPASVTVNLLADGTQVDSAKVTAGEDGSWNYAFTELPKYKAGKEIAYTIEEEPVEGYTADVNGYDVTNAIDTGSLAVSKTVVNGSNDKRFTFTVILNDWRINGERGDMNFENGIATFTLASGETARAEGLPAGVEYAIGEGPADGYTSASTGGAGTIAKDATAEAAFTNTYAATGEAEFYAVKNLVGRTLQAGEFAFELLEGGKVLQTATNDGTGYARFEPLTYNLPDVGEHAYTIREVAGTTAGVTYDAHEAEFNAIVTDNGDGTLSVAYDGYDPEAGVAFTNEYATSGKLALSVAKNLDGKPAAEAGAFSFQLVDGSGNVVSTATNDADGMVAFPEVEFGSVGTFKYTIREVVPEGAAQVGNKLVYDGVAYDRSVIGVEVQTIDNGDGTLRFVTTYADNTPDAPAFDNETVAPAHFSLQATKVMEGRAFQAGDEFTFTLAAQDEGAPMPESAEVTVKPTSGTETAVSFGDIAFTADDLGKTFTYTVKEADTPSDAKGVTNDPFAHVVKVTVGAADDGTLVATPEYDNGAEGITFTNTYEATGTAQLFAQKTLTGRALQADEFFFTLSGDGLETALHAGADADGRAEFAPITYTQADAGKDFHYTITEDEGALPGITYDDSIREVTVHVEDNGDGTLAVTYDGEPAYAVAAFANTYKAEGVSVGLKATKLLAGGEVADGQFSFALRGVSENALGTEQTVANAADGTVSFDAITYDAAGTYEYEITEVVPEGATDNGDGTWTAGTVVYDGTAHNAVVTVTDDGLGKLVADVAYDGAGALTITNGVKLSRAGFSFDKYCFGGTGVFDFVLAAANADGSLRSGNAVEYAADDAIVDDGAAPFAVTVQNGAFASNKAEVVFPEISFAADGDYYYLVYEDEQDTADMVTDDAQYLVHVTVAGGEVADTVYELVYDGKNYGPTDDHSFYNNATVTLGFSSLSAQSYTGLGERVSVYPQVKKYLNGDTAQLVGGDFEFELVDEATGTVLAAATNDENGNVAFYDESVDPGLVYDAPGTYRYVIREVAGDVAGVTYDSSQITLVVTVEQTADGLVAETLYNGPGGSDPAFYNTKEGIDVTVQKVSRYGGEGLANCTYALWMVGENGDALVKEATSDERGFITFTDVNLVKGQKYYFKEVAAPSGHTVDPYRTAYFTLNEAGTALVLAEQTAADGWHSADKE